ncbi:MAG TPA: hypothetical protein PKA31_00360 [Candidatus Moranbacteria bacterium]|nr:hypothetical protein [Candidatus Moranbacteria bacterium]
MEKNVPKRAAEIPKLLRKEGISRRDLLAIHVILRPYRKKLHELGFPYRFLRYEIMQTEEHTEIRFCSDIVPLEFIKKTLGLNEEKKYKVEFTFREPGTVDIKVSDKALVPFGGVFIGYLLGEIIECHDEECRRAKKEFKKTAKLLPLPFK